VGGQLDRAIALTLRSIVLCDELGDIRSLIEGYAYTGSTFHFCGLIEESDRIFRKAIELYDQSKMADYVRVIPAYAWWAMHLMAVNLSDAISKSLKALEYSLKADSRMYIGYIYGTLVIEYALAGDTAHMDEYFEKLMCLPKHFLSNPSTRVSLGLAMGTYYAAKNEFDKSNEYFKHHTEHLPNPFSEAGAKQLYAWSLMKQGKTMEAGSQLAEAQKILKTAKETFSQVNVQASLMTLTRPEANQTFYVRLDLVNVSTSQGSITKVENLLAPELEITEVSPNCLLRYGNVEFKDAVIKPFEVRTVKLTVRY